MLLTGTNLIRFLSDDQPFDTKVLDVTALIGFDGNDSAMALVKDDFIL